MTLNRFTILISLFAVLSFFAFLNKSFAGDTTRVSFTQQNKNHKFTSFSFGMGVNYDNNPSLKDFIQYEIPQYNALTPTDQLSDFSSSLNFFGGVEKQVSKNLSLKLEYSYFIKSYNVSVFPQYDFSYKNHQPFLILNYIFPEDYFYIKTGVGLGYIFSNFTVKEFGTEKSYTSTGLGLKFEAVLNAQISKNVAGYISGNINKSFLQNLKDGDGNNLKSRSNGDVNLSSFGVGLRLGLEVYIF
jgi:hypothetical protein